MLRLVTSAATTQGNRSKEMSLIRRIILQSRLILRNYQLIFGKGKIELPEFRTLRIEGQPNIIRGNANASLPSSGTSASGSSVGSASTLQRIGHQIQSQVRQIFINNVLRRATTNQEVARKAAQRLLYGDSRPFFALVGVSLATGSAGIVSQESEFDGICWEIRESVQRQSKTQDEAKNEGPMITSVSDLSFGPILNQGCNAAVYSAKLRDAENAADSPLAVKVMFNYDIESNAFAILKGMVKEIVPAKRIDLKSLYEMEQTLFNNVKRCPPHPNIIEIKDAFVDQMPLLPDGIDRFPSALPRRLNPNDGLGRNMSLFLVMKRYDCTLKEYLNTQSSFPLRTRLLILTQVLGGVAHLEQNLIAHRDLKTDNILMDISQGYDYPEVVIADFGCCLADKSLGLDVPFRTFDTDRGGNAALTAPEIANAVPGTWKYLSYKKSDAWSAGTLAYEIFGTPNPFYEVRNSEGPTTRLDSRTYKEEDLPPVDGASHILQNLICSLLRRNPNQRISAEKAFNVCILLLWAPSQWSDTRFPNDDEILQWLVCLTAKSLCHSSDELEFKIMRNFLRKVKFSVLKSAVQWIVQFRK